MSPFNPQPAVGVLPADGWEARVYPNEEAAKENKSTGALPVIGWLIYANNTGTALIANDNGHVDTVTAVAQALKIVIKVHRVTESESEGRLSPDAPEGGRE